MNGYSTGTIGFETFSETVFQFRITPWLAAQGSLRRRRRVARQPAARLARRAAAGDRRTESGMKTRKNFANIHIEPRRSGAARRDVRIILLVVIVVALASRVWFAWPKRGRRAAAFSAKTGAGKSPAPSSHAGQRAARAPGDYGAHRQRLHHQPRAHRDQPALSGVVKWIGVKKGDRSRRTRSWCCSTTPSRQRACSRRGPPGQRQGRRWTSAELDYRACAKLLRATNIETPETEDEARLRCEAARPRSRRSQAQLDSPRRYLDWTVIRSPIDGVVLEKLADPGELVTPQSFGGTRGPSTALLAVADPQDLQVEIDLNETDLAEDPPGQRCRVSPEAYPGQALRGLVAEIAPEANRQKGTLQIKVQIEKPDRFLTPELSARVGFSKP